MSGKIRHGLLAILAMLTLAVGALAQQPPSIGKQQLFPTPDAAADALNDAAKRGDGKALEAILGAPWSALAPLQSDGFKRDLAAYFSQWDKQHKVTIDPASNGANHGHRVNHEGQRGHSYDHHASHGGWHGGGHGGGGGHRGGGGGHGGGGHGGGHGGRR